MTFANVTHACLPRAASALASVFAATALLFGCSASSNSSQSNIDAGNEPRDSGTMHRDAADSASDANTSGHDSGEPAPEGGPTSDSSTTDSGPFVEAVHPALPTLIVQGGKVLNDPAVVTVTFPGDTSASALELFGKTVTNNPWWDAVRGGFCDTSSTCVGDGPAGTAVEVTTSPGDSFVDVSDPGQPSALRTYILGLVSSGVLPTPTAQSLFVFYFPASTKLYLDHSLLCVDLGAYHDFATYNGVNFTYAIVPECTNEGATDLTTLASHEIVEATTDPFPVNSGLVGYWLNLADPSIVAWQAAIGGGEAADMCYDPWQIGQDRATENGFTVQRIWNNQKAAAGHNPCVPDDTSPYFNAAPSKWLLIAEVNASATFTAIAYSDAPIADGWTVYGYDYTGAVAESPYMTITVNGASKATVHNGDKLNIVVTLKQNPESLTDSDGAAEGWLCSSINTPGVGDAGPTLVAAHYWPFIIASTGSAAHNGLTTLDPTEN